MGFSNAFSKFAPKSDESNYYTPYFMLNLFSWTNIVNRMNLSFFNEAPVRNQLTLGDYERVLQHIDRCTKRTRQLMEMLLYIWLVIVFFPSYTIHPLEDSGFFLAKCFALVLRLYLITAPAYFFYYVYGRQQSFIGKIQSALDEMNEREFYHRGCRWSIDSSGRFIHVQLNFSHIRGGLSGRTQSTAIEIPKIINLEADYRPTAKEEDMLDIIRGRKSRILQQPLI